MTIIDTLLTSKLYSALHQVKSAGFCTKCLAEGKTEPGQVPLNSILEAFIDETDIVTCPKNSAHKVNLAEIAPDMSMPQVPKLRPDQVQLNEMGGTNLYKYSTAHVELINSFAYR